MTLGLKPVIRWRKEVRTVRRKAVRRIFSIDIEITMNCDRVMLKKQQPRIFLNLWGWEWGVTRGPQVAATRRSNKGRWFGGMTSVQQSGWGYTNRDVLKVTMTSKEGTSPTYQACWNRKPPLERVGGGYVLGGKCGFH